MSYYPPTRSTVFWTPPATPVPSSPFEPIFNAALLAYQEKTRKDLPISPLVSTLKTCKSADAIIAELRKYKKSRGFHQPRTTFARFIDSTSPAVLFSVPATIGIVLDLFYPFIGPVFATIGAILAATYAFLASREALGHFFEDIELFFSRLEIYLETTLAMTDITVRILVEVLSVLTIAEKDKKQGRLGRFLMKLVGGSDVEDALRRLNQLMQQEALMVATRGLKGTHAVDNQVMDTCSEVLVSTQGAGYQRRGTDICDSGGHLQRSGEECV